MDNNEYMYAVGRMVQGDVFNPQTKNMTGGPLMTMAGEPKVQYFIGVAMPKTDPAFNDIWAKLSAIAAAGFPGGEASRADFAWKVIDGDLPQHAQKAGFPGHWVFRFTSGYPVNAYTTGAAQQITDPQQIKRGYYIRVPFTAKANGNAQKPGVYLNMALVELIGYGEEISSGPDAQALLAGGGAVALPQGASATPVAGAAPLTPGPGTAPPGPGMLPTGPGTNPPGPGGPPVAGGPGATVAGGPGTALPPGPGTALPPGPGAVLPGAQIMPGAGPGTTLPGAPTPAAVGPQMTALAAGGTYDSFIAQGWTDDLLVQHGYMTAPAAAVVPATDFLAPPVMTAAAAGGTYEAYIAQGWTDDLLVQHGYMVARA
jgi:hypothetical protein